MKKTFEEAMVFDGAFGTYFHQLKNVGSACELANLEDSDMVYRIHREYISAGANAIKTNSFAVNSAVFADKTLRDKIIEKGFEIASAAVKGSNVKVFADIGYINSSNDDVSNEYCDIVMQYIELGATNFLFETNPEFEQLVPALKLIQENVVEAFVIVSFSVSQDGYTRKGFNYKKLIAEAKDSKMVDVIGLNCTCGPSHMLELIEFLDLSDTEFCAMPNAGYPENVVGRTYYRDNVGYFSRKVSEIYKCGVKIIGGCCGTTPEHIRATVLEIAKLDGSVYLSHDETTYNNFSKNNKNIFKDKLLAGEIVIAVELDPPVNTDTRYIISAAGKAYSSGADIITISDSPLAKPRADSAMIAAKIKREIGIDVLPHMTCRDRNSIGIKSSLLAVNIEEIKNILAVTGDPVSDPDRNDGKGVFSFNSFNLISYINSLNSGVFEDSPFFIGGALNINAQNFEAEILRALKKKEAGADFFLSQPMFSKESVERLLLARKRLSSKLLAGILPVAGYKNALFLDNEVAGISIPNDIIESFNGKTEEEVQKISFDYCTSLVDNLKGKCDGYYLISPLKNIDVVCRLIKYIRGC